MHSLGAHTVVLDVLADVVVDGGRQGHVEEAIGVHAARQCLDVRVQACLCLCVYVPLCVCLCMFRLVCVCVWLYRKKCFLIIIRHDMTLTLG